MSETNDDRNKLSEHEREDARLAEIVRANLPLPETPSSTDRAQILHYINSEPSLTTFRKKGLERFLANVGVLSDGRVICTIKSQFGERLYPLLWGSEFGMCILLGLAAAFLGNSADTARAFLRFSDQGLVDLHDAGKHGRSRIKPVY